MEEVLDPSYQFVRQEAARLLRLMGAGLLGSPCGLHCQECRVQSEVYSVNCLGAFFKELYIWAKYPRDERFGGLRKIV